MAVILEEEQNSEVKIADEEVLRLLGYNIKRRKAPKKIYQIISEERRELLKLSHPKAVYQIFDRSELEAHKVFNNAEKIAFCICTIGSELEQRVSQLFQKKEMLRGLVLDALGSETAEQIANWAFTEICHQATQLELNHSYRFSPGYGKWGLEAQDYIFSLLPADTINVSLTASMMMIPRKSISFAVKLGTADYKDEVKATCKNCNMRHRCRYRKEK